MTHPPVAVSKMSVSLSTNRCQCTADHRPATMRSQGHHLWPIFLGGPSVDSTLVPLCPSTHDLAHHILRAMLANGWYPFLQGRGWTKYAHMIATLGYQAWDAAGSPAPRTTGYEFSIVPMLDAAEMEELRIKFTDKRGWSSWRP